MSYESKLVFESEQDAVKVLATIAKCVSMTKVLDAHVHIKDPNLNSKSTYDVQLTLQPDYSIWMEVIFSSKKIYKLMENSLASINYKCLEDGDMNEVINLKKRSPTVQAPKRCTGNRSYKG